MNKEIQDRLAEETLTELRGPDAREYEGRAAYAAEYVYFRALRDEVVPKDATFTDHMVFVNRIARQAMDAMRAQREKGGAG